MGAARRLSGRERVRRHFRDAEAVDLVAEFAEGLGAAWQGETSYNGLGMVVQNKKEVSKMSGQVCNAEWRDYAELVTEIAREALDAVTWRQDILDKLLSDTEANEEE